MKRIFSSLISAHLLTLEQEIKSIEPYIDGFHIDVMDNHFVPNLTWGNQFINAIADATNKLLWIHLMVTDPIGWIEQLFIPKGSIISFHYESAKNDSHNTIKKIINAIKQKNYIASITINPETNIEAIFPYLKEIDHVLIMSVHPGFSGQTFIGDSFDKIEELYLYRKNHNLKFNIGIDGGVTLQNIHQLSLSGIDDFAIASAIYQSKNKIEAAKLLREKM